MSVRIPRHDSLSESDVPEQLFDSPVDAAADRHVLHNKAGISSAAAGQYPAALQNFETAVLLRPTYAEAWFHRGMLLNQLGKLEQAYESFAQATILAPLYEAADEKLATLSNAIGRPKTVLTPWSRTPTPSTIARWGRMARRLFDLRDRIDYAGDKDKEETVIRAKLAQDPRSVQLALAMAAVLAGESRLIEATLFLRYALALHPWSGEAVLRLSVVLQRNSANSREIKSLALSALEAGATDERLAPLALWHGLALGEWRDYDSLHAATIKSLKRAPASVTPFVALHLTNDPAQHRRCADAFHKTFGAQAKPLHRGVRDDVDRPVTLGYLSADFREHPAGAC